MNLTVAERLAIISVVNNPENKVPTSDLKVYLSDVDKFRFTEEEKTAIEWVEEKNPEGQITAIKWSPTAPEKDIEVTGFTRTYLREKVSKLEVSASDPLANPIASLLEKLK